MLLLPELLLRDSIDAPLIPRDTPVIAGYGDGRYCWSPAWKASGGLPAGANWWDLFPRSVQLVIVVNAANAGDVLDVEWGDASPADVPGWCDRFNRPGRRAPTIYCDRNTWPMVQQAAGGRRVDYWIGTLDGTRDVAGAVAVQYTDTGAYDESVIHDPSWVGLEDPMALDPNDPVVQSIMGNLKAIGDLATAIAQETANGVSTGPGGLVARLAAQQQALMTAIAAAPPGSGLTVGQAQLLQDVHDAVTRIEQALSKA